MKNAEKNKKGIRILSVQPTRIAVTNISSRVAYLRNEKIDYNNTIGYLMRGKVKNFKNCASALFCTTGIMFNLMALSEEHWAKNYSHIILVNL